MGKPNKRSVSRARGSAPGHKAKTTVQDSPQQAEPDAPSGSPFDAATPNTDIESAPPTHDRAVDALDVLSEGATQRDISSTKVMDAVKRPTGLGPDEQQSGSKEGEKIEGPIARKIVRVRVEDIVIGEKRRALNDEKAQELAESMSNIGLMTPIVVRWRGGKTVLVAGVHRLEGAKSLGWVYIDAIYMQGDETDARLWEIDENLCRAELTVLERSELIDERRRLIGQKQKVGQVAQPGGKQPADAGVSKTARDLRASREEVRRASAIASISEAAKASAKEAGLADNQSALLAIAKEKPTAQLSKVQEIADQKAARSRRKPSPAAEETANSDRGAAVGDDPPSAFTQDNAACTGTEHKSAPANRPESQDSTGDMQSVPAPEFYAEIRLPWGLSEECRRHIDETLAEWEELGVLIIRSKARGIEHPEDPDPLDDA